MRYIGVVATCLSLAWPVLVWHWHCRGGNKMLGRGEGSWGNTGAGIAGGRNWKDWYSWYFMPTPSHFVYAQQSYRLSWYVCIDNAAAFFSLCLYTLSNKHVKPNLLQLKLPLLICVLFVSSHGWTLVVSLCCVTEETWVFMYGLEG